MNGFFVIDRWFRIDCRKFRQAFLNTIKRWSLMFKQHLIDHVTNSLKELAEFIKITNGGLEKEPVEGDFEGLVEVMGLLGNVKERQQATDAMFEPLKQTIDLLKTYNQEMPEEVHLQLEVGDRVAGVDDSLTARSHSFRSCPRSGTTRRRSP